MKVTLLMGHRVERYPGEYGPEVLAAVDEFTQEENPAWWDGEKERVMAAQEASDFEAVGEVVVELNVDDVMAVLYPWHDPLDGEVLADEGGPVTLASR